MYHLKVMELSNSVTGNENDYGIKYEDGGTPYRINNAELIVGALILGTM